MKINSLDQLFEHELEDLLSAEQQLVEALPKMVDAASADSLKTPFKDHLKQTKPPVSRLGRHHLQKGELGENFGHSLLCIHLRAGAQVAGVEPGLSLIHISEPTRPY